MKNPKQAAAKQLDAVSSAALKALSSPAKLTANLEGKIGSAALAKMEEFARGHEAAFLKDLVDLEGLVGNLAGGYEADLGLSRPETGGLGGRPLPDLETKPGFKSPHEELLGSLPRNTDAAPMRNAGPSEKGGARRDAAAARPSTNPRDWAGGATSQDGADPTYNEYPLDNGGTQRVWHFSNGSFVEEVTVGGDGSPRTTTIFAYEAESGEQSGETSLYDQNGDLVLRTTFRANADGSSSGSTTVRNGGTYTTSIWEKDAGGQKTGGTVEKTSSDDLKKGMAVLPGTESGANSAFARYLARRFSHGKKAGPPVVTHVNPGDPDYARPVRGSRLKPGKGIIDVEEQKSRHVSRERAEHWQQELKDKVGGKVNPPGPNDIP
jgi:hypothetical protein